MYETFIDLDELIVHCRDKQAKKFIQEAVACYRAGAFRSCIVATWNAVVFDFLHKLRELSLLENNERGEATTLLKEFDNYRIKEDVKNLWQFESKIPKVALKTFELISPIEQTDIERLLEDRNRCAHPSMKSLEEPFEATAEQARTHLRNTVMNFLRYPPIQGMSAFNFICESIKSDYFPVDHELAIRYFQKTPLAGARKSLIKNLVIGLTKSLLLESLSEDERNRQFSALKAISKMYSEFTGEALNDKLSDIILNRVVDANWDKVIIYLSNITSWEKISESCQIKAKVFIEKLEIYKTKKSFLETQLNFDNINIIVKAYYIDFLREVVICKLQIPINDLIEIKQYYKDKILNEKVINPLIINGIHQATLNNLAAMISDTDKTLHEIVELRIKDEIKEASLDDLRELILEYKNEYLHELIKPHLKDKFSDASLETLLWSIFNLKLELTKIDKELIELANNYLTEKIQKISFDKFDELRQIKSKYPHSVIEQHFKNLIKNNVDGVVDRFVNSNRWNDAKFNTTLLQEISDELNSKHWKLILEAFCKNDQIYGYPYDQSIAFIFITLFENSVKTSGTVQPYWLDFRKNLDKLPETKNVKPLKLAIDDT